MAKKLIKMKCPRCKKPSVYDPKSDFRPFCSQPCKDDDITAWADEEYQSPDREASPEELVEAIRNRNNN